MKEASIPSPASEIQGVERKACPIPCIGWEALLFLDHEPSFSKNMAVTVEKHMLRTRTLFNDKLCWNVFRTDCCLLPRVVADLQYHSDLTWPAND